MQGDNISFKEEFKQNIPIIIAAVVFGVLVFLAIYFGSLSYPELFYEDAMYQKGTEINENIKIITIDNATIAEYGDENEWSRSRYSELVNTLCSGESAPSVIAFDIPLFSSRDYKGDISFANACKRAGNVVLPSRVTFQGHSYVEDGKNIINPYYASEVSEPFYDVNEVTRTGFNNMLIDSDGYVRYALLKTSSDEGIQESFAQMIYSMYCQFQGTPVNIFKPNKDNTVLIGYSGKVNSYPKYSMVDVLSGKISPSEFDDCIVLIGMCMDGASDTYKVPIDRQNLMYGVEITANIVQSMIDDHFYVYADRLLMALFCGILATFLMYYTNGKKIRFMVFFLIASLVIYMLLCEILRQSGILLYLIYTPLVLLVVFAVNLIWKYVLERHQTNGELNEMLYSMAEAMTEAVDARTPYNATHTRNVAELSVALAEYVIEQHKQGNTNKNLKLEEVEQLRLAALLHDVGKIDVPQDVLDKPTRLGHLDVLLYNRLEKIILLIKLDLAEERKTAEIALKEISYLENAINKIRSMNTQEAISDQDKMWVIAMSKRCYTYESGDRIPYLTRLELDSLLIPRGTLTESEVDMVREHVIFTNRIISRIKFGKKFEPAREIAAAHHELLNGEGYPNHLHGEEINTATRILTIADIYDALVSDNRPYKKAKTKEETFLILHDMVKNGELDGELLRLAEELWGNKKDVLEGKE